MSDNFLFTKRRAIEVGECMKCGAGARGPVSAYTFNVGVIRARLCLNCLKILRLDIEEMLRDKELA